MKFSSVMTGRRDLVRSDWESWGDCRFMVDSANISSEGDIAWFSTKGYVEFDLSKLLSCRLRLTGVMVKEDQVWKFRQQQFQFDIDFSFSLLAIVIIISLDSCQPGDPR
ncbi:MAG: nuclear transport factor 2 family protein [Marinilabiliales bacterium]|nr:nuclear transport factor 2 family protein [Marinilabiliales bacterium]